MTGEEKRRLLKEKYKQDLKLRKEFLDKAKGLRSQNRINQALGNMLDGMEDDSQDWIDQLNQESAISEAKMDLSLDLDDSDTGGGIDRQLESMAKEAEMQKISAEQLVTKMKQQMGLVPEEEEAPLDEAVEESTEDRKEEPKAATEEEGEESSSESEEEGSTPPPPAKKPNKRSLGDF